MLQANENVESESPEVPPLRIEARDAANLAKLRALLVELERDLRPQSESDV